MGCSKVNALIEVAMSWLDQGIATIPIMYRSKRPNFQALYATGDIDGQGKPTWDRLKTELPTRQNIDTWYKTISNIAVVTGNQNLVIVDFDNLPAYELWMQLYGIKGYMNTYTVHTGRGYHLYFYVEDMPPHTLKWAGGEIKASGYCLIPPSTHPSGRAYKAIHPDMPILDIGSIYDILPEGVFNYQQEFVPCMSAPDPIWTPTLSGNYSEINQQVRILSFFPDARRTGNGWYTVFCPLHSDGENHGRASGWIDDRRNRFGCHSCVSGSLSAIDFYARLKNISASDAAHELSV